MPARSRPPCRDGPQQKAPSDRPRDARGSSRQGTSRGASALEGPTRGKAGGCLLEGPSPTGRALVVLSDHPCRDDGRPSVFDMHLPRLSHSRMRGPPKRAAAHVVIALPSGTFRRRRRIQAADPGMRAHPSCYERAPNRSWWLQCHIEWRDCAS